jgi:WD40 repeat protein
LCLIWEVATGEVVYGQRLGTSASVLMFVRHKPNKQYVSYELIIGIGSTLHKGLFFYDPYKVQWSLQLDSMIVPGGGGLVRNYTCVEVSPDPDALYLYAGTMGGEMLVFRRDSSVLRAVIPVCSNGLHCILVLPDGMIVTGGGDGKLQVLSGNDVSWSIVQQVKLIDTPINLCFPSFHCNLLILLVLLLFICSPLQTILDSCILSLSLSANLNEVLTGCSSGNLYRCNLSDLSKLNVGVGHTSPVLCLAFQTTGTLFVTGTSDGVLRLWDVIDYACQSILRVPTAGSVFCIAISEVQHGHNSCVISGWEDGFIRCHDIDNLSKQLWLIPNAHRGGVTTLAVHVSNDPKALSYIISGGRDGVVRVWRYNNRGTSHSSNVSTVLTIHLLIEFLFEYSDHSKSVAKVLIDIHKNHIIHSVGEDSSILSFDLKSRKRIISHLCPVQSISGISRSNSNSNIKDGKRDSRVLSGILNMTQRKDSEQELITCDGIGRLYHWDIDYRDPVLCLQDPSRSALYCCEVSPSGRYLAYSGVDQILKVLDLRRGRMVALGLAHSGAIMTVSWTADEKQIITGGDDFCLCIWNFFLTADDAIT